MSSLINQIKEIDRDKIIRPEYGKTSLKTWEPIFDEMLKKFNLILAYWDKVDSRTNLQVQNSLTNIFGELNSLKNLNDSQFVSNKEQVINRIAQHYSEVKTFWPQYAIAAIEESGLLNNVDVKKDFEQLTYSLKKTTDEALKKIDIESQSIIEQAKKKADEIESSVRKTAQKISVQEAQDQFGNAAKNNTKNIWIWGGITIGLIILFALVVIGFMLYAKLPEEWTWKVIYYSALRLTIIGFIGTLLAFSLKILKSHLHMKEHNLHRQRIANSMASFAESASNKEQRDLILSRLIDSVATFGNSGMIGSDDEGNSKITIDNITRTLSAIKSGTN